MRWKLRLISILVLLLLITGLPTGCNSKRQIEELSRQVETLTVEKQRLEREKAKLEQDKVEMLRQLKDSEAEISVATSERARLRSENETLRKKVNQLEEQIERLEERIKEDQLETEASEGPEEPAIEECAVAVEAGESIQAAIDGATAGDVICLAAGVWEENLKIEKNVTIRRQTVPVKVEGLVITREVQSTVIGVSEGYPVVWVVAPAGIAQTVSVKLQDLRITQAPPLSGESKSPGAFLGCADFEEGICPNGVLLQGKAQLELIDSTVSENGATGIMVVGPAKARVSHSTISNNDSSGMWLRSTGQAEITSCDISHNFHGILLTQSAGAKISSSTISGNEAVGIYISSSAYVEIVESKIVENIIGIDVGESYPLHLRSFGRDLGTKAQASIFRSIISSNKRDGIMLRGESKATLKQNKIIQNGRYGVALGFCFKSKRPSLQWPQSELEYWKRPWETEGSFFGQVSGGANTIPGTEEIGMNGKAAVCPLELDFLRTEEGGVLMAQGGGRYRVP